MGQHDLNINMEWTAEGSWRCREELTVKEIEKTVDSCTVLVIYISLLFCHHGGAHRNILISCWMLNPKLPGRLAIMKPIAEKSLNVKKYASRKFCSSTISIWDILCGTFLIKGRWLCAITKLESTFHEWKAPKWKPNASKYFKMPLIKNEMPLISKCP